MTPDLPLPVGILMSPASMRPVGWLRRAYAAPRAIACLWFFQRDRPVEIFVQMGSVSSTVISRS